MSSVTLYRHLVWDIFPHTSSFETFKAHYVPSFSLPDGISEDVKRAFSLIRKTMEHSFFEYNFLELARIKALTTFELALKEKYRKIYDKEPEWNLTQLTNFFHTQNFFEASDVKSLHRIINVRNYHAHGQGNWPGFPPMTQRTIEQVLYCVNDLYEDRDLRRERKKIKKAFNKAISRFTNPIMRDGDGFITLYKAQYLFLNNKLQEPKLTIGFSQIDPFKKTKDGHYSINLWTIDFHDNLEFTDEEIALRVYNSEKVYTIVEAQDEFSLASARLVQDHLNDPDNLEFNFQVMQIDSWFSEQSDVLKAEFYKQT